MSPVDYEACPDFMSTKTNYVMMSSFDQHGGHPHLWWLLFFSFSRGRDVRVVVVFRDFFFFLCSPRCLIHISYEDVYWHTPIRLPRYLCFSSHEHSPTSGALGRVAGKLVTDSLSCRWQRAQTWGTDLPLGSLFSLLWWWLLWRSAALKVAPVRWYSICCNWDTLLFHCSPQNKAIPSWWSS